MEPSVAKPAMTQFRLTLHAATLMTIRHLAGAGKNHDLLPALP